MTHEEQETGGRECKMFHEETKAKSYNIWHLQFYDFIRVKVFKGGISEE